MRARRVARRRSVARAAVGTAVIAGTAGAVHHYQDQKWADQDAQQQQYEQEEYEQEVQYEAPLEQASAPDLTTQLKQLSQLHDSGILTDEEFAAGKAKLLAG